MVERGDRARRLNEYVQQEIEEFSRGERASFTPNENLRQMFGYPFRTMVVRDLTQSGIGLQRRELQRQSAEVRLDGSMELAWVLGVLSGKGFIDPSHAEVSLSTPHEDFAHAFKTRAEPVFKANARIDPKVNQPSEETKVTFRSRFLSRAIGDFSADHWVDTIREQYSWVLTDAKFNWSYLAGLFDAVGYPRAIPRFRRVEFISTYLKSCNFIAEALVRAGIQNPTFKVDNSTREDVKGVGIYNAADLKLFAENVHSTVAEKEKVLDQIRNWEVGKRVVTVKTQPDEVVEERRRLREMLGHSPKWQDIDELRKQGITRFSRGPYLRIFGEGNNHNLARQRLEAATQGSPEETSLG